MLSCFAQGDGAMTQVFFLVFCRLLLAGFPAPVCDASCFLCFCLFLCHRYKKVSSGRSSFLSSSLRMCILAGNPCIRDQRSCYMSKGTIGPSGSLPFLRSPVKRQAPLMNMASLEASSGFETEEHLGWIECEGFMFESFIGSHSTVHAPFRMMWR